MALVIMSEFFPSFQVHVLLELRAVLMEYAHASLVMKDQTVAAARKVTTSQQMEHVKVFITRT